MRNEITVEEFEWLHKNMSFCTRKKFHTFSRQFPKKFIIIAEQFLFNERLFSVAKNTWKNCKHSAKTRGVIILFGSILDKFWVTNSGSFQVVVWAASGLRVLERMWIVRMDGKCRVFGSEWEFLEICYCIYI